MADISDVLNGIAQTLGSALYPNGTGSASITGYSTRCYPGWPPSKNQLDADLTQNIVNISIYPLGTEKLESVINQDEQLISLAAAGTTITINGPQVTIGGSPKVGDVACLSVNRNPQAYAVLATDTTATIAAALAALFTGATVSGAVIMLPSSTFLVSGTVSTPATVMMPVRRLARTVQVRCWASTPTARDATAKAVYTALWNAERLSLPDGTFCGIVYGSDRSDDNLQKANLYTRDILVSARFMETISANAQTVADLLLNFTTPEVTNPVQFNIGA